MTFTKFRVYHAHVERTVTNFEVSLYNMFGREIETIYLDTSDEVRETLREYKTEEPKFTSNWTF